MDIDLNNLLEMALENPTEGAITLAVLLFAVAGVFKYMPLIAGYFLTKTVGLGVRTVGAVARSFGNGLGAGSNRSLPRTASETLKYVPRKGDRWYFPEKNLQVRVSHVDGLFSRGAKHVTFEQTNSAWEGFGTKRKDWTMTVEDFRSAIINRKGEPFQTV